MGCTSSRLEFDFSEFQIENVEATERERPVCDAVQPLMAQTADILARLAQYRLLRLYQVAVRTPSVENDVAAWNAVVPAVNMLKGFFEFYDQFREAMLRLLQFICADDPYISLPENLMCAKLLVSMMDFIIRFDELKMGKASIQNDFSFYRRSMNRMKRGDAMGDAEVERPPVNEEVANRMSLFFAYPNPFTKALIDEFGRMDVSREHLARCFGLVANACRAMAERHTRPAEREEAFALFRAMVAAILFYDYVSPQGVFVKRSEVDVVACIVALKRHEGDATDMLNTIRYGTHSFSADTTPRRVIEAMT